MKPLQTAIDWCDANNEDLIAIVDNHLAHGWVYSGEDAFVVATLESRELLLRPNLNKEVDKDTWYVYLYAGNLKRVLELIPFQMEWVAFRRDNGPIRFYRTNKLLKRIGR
jgi:hypothetical protein|tara:strand:- start:2360 stop:2689 length:330 start_codon:yes stop_codon:yes gene_type:complete